MEKEEIRDRPCMNLGLLVVRCWLFVVGSSLLVLRLRYFPGWGCCAGNRWFADYSAGGEY